MASPHASAGRIPTHAGLRLFVDGLLEIGDLTKEERREIDARLAGRGRNFEAALDEAMNEIGRCYTMARERLIHAEYAVPKDAAPEGEEAQAETAAVEAAPAEADEFADLLF